jgi:hypothetical protein
MLDCPPRFADDILSKVSSSDGKTGWFSLYIFFDSKFWLPHVLCCLLLVFLAGSQIEPSADTYSLFCLDLPVSWICVLLVCCYGQQLFTPSVIAS